MKEEDSIMTNREILRDIHTNLLQMKTTVTRIETKQENEKERMDKHEKSIDNLKVWRNVNVGAILSALGIPWIK